MATQFQLDRSELIIQVQFAIPMFRSFHTPYPLYQELLSRLGPLGLRLADIKTEFDAGSLASAGLSFWLPNLGTHVKLTLERLELHCSRLNEQDQAQLQRVFAELLTCVTIVEPDNPPSTYATTLSAHGRLVGTTQREFLDSFTARMPEIGPAMGSGHVFYFGATGAKFATSVTIDVSSLVAEGLYLRLYSGWDPKQVTSTELGIALADVFDLTLEKLGLERAE